MMPVTLYGVPIVWEGITAYNTVSATMFSFWDYFITFGDEVELIWGSNNSWVSVLFFSIRYLTLSIRLVHLVFCTTVFGLIAIPKFGCLLWLWFQVISGQLLFVTVDVLLITRVYAFYGRNKYLLAALLTLLAGNISAVIVLIAKTIPKAQVISSPLPPNIHAAPCFATSIPTSFSSLWVPPLIFEGILFSLVLFKFIRTRINTPSISPTILVVFVRDDAWAFAVIFAVALWATLAYELTKNQGNIALTWHYSVLGFCGTRLILNLRSAGKEGSSAGSTSMLDPVSEVRFRTLVETRGVLSVEEDVWGVEWKPDGQRGSISA